MYLFFLIVHILSAVAFVGYVFFDVCIFPFAKKHVDEDTLARVKKAYTKGTAFLLLIISGVYMAKDYFGGENGWLGSSFQILLATKIGVLGLMCLITAISLFYVYKLKKPDPFGKYSHIIALVLCVIMIILAKVMWRV